MADIQNCRRKRKWKNKQVSNNWRLRHKKVLVVFIALDVSRNGIEVNGISPKLFMGFGYNPDLDTFGERLDILNFYSWMKRLQDEFSSEWFVYDASGYYIVNRTPQKKINKLGDKPTAEQILDALVSEQERPKRQDIMRNCEKRSQYLQRAIELIGISASYVDSRQVFREDVIYRDALNESLEFVERLKKDNPELIARILPANPNPASKLYLPLEIAEALYLESKFGVGGKFGPQTEEFFDEAIFGLTRQKGVSYQSIRCPFGPRKPGYLSDRNVIWTSSPDYFVSGILESDETYREFVGQYLEPFRQNGEPIEQIALRTKRQLKLEEVI